MLFSHNNKIYVVIPSSVKGVSYVNIYESVNLLQPSTWIFKGIGKPRSTSYPPSPSPS